MTVAIFENHSIYNMRLATTHLYMRRTATHLYVHRTTTHILASDEFISFPLMQCRK
jgi:hypothetical protein